MTHYNIAAGIVLYNPDVNRLKENIEAIEHQVDLVILIENGSSNTQFVNALVGEKVIVISNKVNEGIAYALNQICSYCLSHDFQWVITLDQDSVVSDNIIRVFTEFINDDVGIICPKIVDRHFSTVAHKSEYYVREIDWCFTSASLTSILAWKTVGGFDESMFIDWVDWDFCVALRAHGYKILQTSKTSMLHELGVNPRIIEFHGRKMYSLNRPSFRYYYVIRNRLYMARKWDSINLKGEIVYAIITILFILKYEENKWKNFLAMTRGFLASFIMPIRYKSL